MLREAKQINSFLSQVSYNMGIILTKSHQFDLNSIKEEIKNSRLVIVDLNEQLTAKDKQIKMQITKNKLL